MTVTMVVAWILLGQLVAFWALALVIWLVAELTGTEDITFARSVATSMFVLALNFLLLGVAAGAQMAFNVVDSPHVALGLISCLALVQLVLPIFLFKYYLHTSFPRALVIWGAGVLGMVAAAVLMAAGIRAKVAEVVAVANSNMAPEVRNEYAWLICANCQREYVAGVSAKVRSENASHPAATPIDLVCPHCGATNPWSASDEMHEADCVLIDKAVQPKKDPGWRWRLVGYRPPLAERTTHLGRVVGLPEETVQILGGDIFINQVRSQKRPEDPELWFPVYDSRVQPKTRLPNGPGWKPYQAAGWEEHEGKWRCRAGGQTRELAFTRVITDAPTYDCPRDLPRNFKPLPLRDVQVTCTVEQFSGDGLFGVRWDYGDSLDDLSLSCGVRLWPSGGAAVPGAPANAKGMRYQLVTQPVERRPNDPIRNPELSDNIALAFRPGMKITFGVRDGVTYVMLDGQPLAVLPVEPLDVEAAARRDETPKRWNMLRLVARDCRISLGDITVERDVYYRTVAEMGERAFTFTPNGNRNPVALAPGEFLILGDNSDHSYDCRYYGPILSTQVGGAVRSIVWPRDRWQNLP